MVSWASALWHWWSFGLLAPAGFLLRWFFKNRSPQSQPEPGTWTIVDRRSQKNSHGPGRGLARLLSSPARLALKEAGEEATQEEVEGLREDLDRILADNKRLRLELASFRDSSTLFTAMDTTKTIPLTPPIQPLKTSSEFDVKPGVLSS